MLILANYKNLSTPTITPSKRNQFVEFGIQFSIALSNMKTELNCSIQYYSDWGIYGEYMGNILP